ncbi:MAG: GNAT family N-acetyltransferase [Gaiellaceae bacterium]
MSDFEIRTCAPEELGEALRPIWQYFGAVPSPEDLVRFAPIFPAERLHAARERGKVVGAAGAIPFVFTVPGAQVRAAGVTSVGVDPTHRRRGILRSLMRAQLDDVHERGESVAILWASDERIYGRYGYGLASLTGELRLESAHDGFRAPVEGDERVRLVEREEAFERFPRVHDAVCRVTPGMFERTPDWWEGRRLGDRPEDRHGAGVLMRVLVEREDEPVAYALYRHRVAFLEGRSDSVLEVVEAMGIDAPATARVWRYLLDVDWIDRVHAHLLPVDHPLFLLLAEPRRMRFRVGDALWLRLVDVAAALSARGYASAEPLVVEVADAFCPWNDGRYLLEGGRAGRSEADPDLRLDVGDLAGPYLGGFSFAQLARAGRVEELRRGAVERADAIFRSDRAPWCPEIF